MSLRVRTVNSEQAEPLMLQALKQVGLHQGFLDRKTLELSGGEMQRVALASALVSQPPMLLLDEQAGVQVPQLMQLAESIVVERELQRFDLPRHENPLNLPPAQARLLVMASGQILLDGMPAEVMVESEALRQAHVTPPVVVELSRALWPQALPAVTVDQLMRSLPAISVASEQTRLSF